MEVSLIEGSDALYDIRPEWIDLWERSPRASCYLSPVYGLNSWLAVAEPAGSRLVCVVGREEGRLVLIWPLKVHRRAVWLFAKPLAYNAHETADILTEESPQRSARMAAALSFALKASRVDFLDLPFVPERSDLGALASSLPARRRTQDFANPIVVWRKNEAWDDYFGSLGKETRKVLQKKKRRLESAGALTFDLVTDDESLPALIRTLLAFKREWSRKIDDVGAWVHSDGFEKLLIAASARADADKGGLVVFALKLDDAILALQVATVRQHVDWLVSAYNPDHQHASPGLILNEFCLRWAHERGLNVTMGPGLEPNKLFWSRTQSFGSTSYKVAASSSGAAALQALELRRGLTALAKRLSRPGENAWVGAHTIPLG